MKESTTEQLGLPSKPNVEVNDISNEEVNARFDGGTIIDDALAEAVRDALLFHKRMNNPVAAWIDGKVVWLSPEEIHV